ncbi:ABC transporter substrate-binding protein [Nocardioides deserti]|uniref:ABC transporter substrate-binding protein n=1 Tax=Nocardioides deserti TaxID=1588644 RepID=A0ABR6UAM2_9ACTN|nr:ABC transporter substrate-binding protein [Nocardioides deserti]MBC2961492.1 ABC transporter substrate-binding protein [Nocardioides deserti]GGO78363.1 glycine/betaine ABC transporter permease [Nocardioides deserti]
MQLRRAVLSLAAVGVLSLGSACAGDDLSEESGDGATPAGSGGEVTLATQSFDEAALVGAMYAAVLEDAGYDVTTKEVGRRDIYVQQMPGQVDVAPEYVGGIADFMNTTVNGPDAEPITTTDTQETVDAVTPLLEEKGLTLLAPSEATSQNAYFVTQEFSEAEGVTTLSDLEGTSVVLAANEDCPGRADCEAGLEDVYGIDVTEVLPLGFASPQTYAAVLDGEAQVGQTGTLDGTLEDQGLVLLEDDQQIQPAQNLVPLVSQEFLDEHPDAQQPLEDLMGALDNETLGSLIARVTVDRETPQDVARDFLEEEGLL